MEVGGLEVEVDGTEEEGCLDGPEVLASAEEEGCLAGPDEVLASAEEEGCLAGTDEVLVSAEEGCLAGPDEVLASAEEGCIPGLEVEVDGTVDGEGLAFPVELGFSGGRLVGRDEVDGPVEAEDGPVEKALAGLVVFLARFTIRFATAVERILMASSILFSFNACSLAFFLRRWSW